MDALEDRALKWDKLGENSENRISFIHVLILELYLENEEMYIKLEGKEE